MSDASGSNLVNARVSHTTRPGVSPQAAASEADASLPPAIDSSDAAKVVPPRVQPARSAGAPAALEAMDRAMASEADRLLQSDIPNIESVLDGVFEQRAALVQKPDGRPAAPPPPPPPRPPAPPVVEREPEPLREPIPAPVSVPAPVAAVEPPPQSPPAAQRTQGVKELQGASPSQPTVKPKVDWSAPLRALIVRLLAILVALTSLPLRIAPPRARTVINWLAITLLIWVAFVWVFVLFFRR